MTRQKGKLAVEFGVGKATVSGWEKNRGEIDILQCHKWKKLKFCHHAKVSVN